MRLRSMPLRWFFIAALAFAAAVMHTGVFGVCTDEGAGTTTAVAMQAVDHNAGDTPQTPAAPDEHGSPSTQACQATLPPAPVGLMSALAALALIAVALVASPPWRRVRFSARQWHPPPLPQSSLCVWRI
jgi:hypothetical protein